MADLYARLQELKKRKRASATPGADTSSGTPAAGSPDGAEAGESAAAVERSPGPDWERRAPGVYERSRVYPIARKSLPFDMDEDGRWYGLSPLTGPHSGVRPVFLDVETSGLSGGAGSTAFLIGLGFLAFAPVEGHASGAFPVEPAVTVYQLFLSEPSAEPALLARFAELVGAPDTACFVTYNGASFDLPVLRTRHIMNRLRLPGTLHWDLMPLTRRLYAPAIGSCTLGRVERLVLELGRDDDVPGSEVPPRYHRFIDTGEQAEIAPVLAHHYYDVAHLALLAATLQGILRDGDPRRRGVGHDRVALAKFLLDRGDQTHLARCAALLDEDIRETEERRRHVSAAARAGGFAARAGVRPPRAWSASRELRAVVSRRLKQWDELREIRRSLWLVRGTQYDAVELAKVLEHRFRDYSGALSVIEGWQEASGSRDPDPEIAHRADRLRRKLSRR
ncbi:MAG: ribonuclease H-like domain-containing protein [Alkalispirochaeta sp.]